MNTEVQAESKYIRISARKIRQLARAIKYLSPSQALTTLKFTNKSASMPLIKTIKSAIANAINNAQWEEKSLRFKSIIINEGPTLKRIQPVSRGSAHPILKRSSHIKVILERENSQSVKKMKNNVQKIDKSKNKSKNAQNNKNRKEA